MTGAQGGHGQRAGRQVLTWGVDQGHVGPGGEPGLLHQSSGHSLSLFVQLDAGGGAGDCALGKQSWALLSGGQGTTHGHSAHSPCLSPCGQEPGQVPLQTRLQSSQSLVVHHGQRLGD